MDPVVPLLPPQRISVNANKPINIVISTYHRVDLIASDRQRWCPWRCLQAKDFARDHGGKDLTLAIKGEISVLGKKDPRDNRSVTRRIATAGVQHLKVIVDEFPKFVRA